MPFQVGLRLIEEFRGRVRAAITDDPILPVAQHYETELAAIKVTWLPAGWKHSPSSPGRAGGHGQGAVHQPVPVPGRHDQDDVHVEKPSDSTNTKHTGRDRSDNQVTLPPGWKVNFVPQVHPGSSSRRLPVSWRA